MDEREMYDEINALIGAVAKALEVSEMEVVTAIEQGRLGLEMKIDAEGRNYVEATCDGKTAHVYQGAIFRPDDHGPGDPGEDSDCGDDSGGCSCGH
jgi:hypothetical protein